MSGGLRGGKVVRWNTSSEFINFFFKLLIGFFPF